jgi:hypothetical protein
MELPPKPEPNPLFLEFEQSIHAKYGAIIQACMELIPIGNALFDTPVAEPVQKVIRFLAKMVLNSNGAIIVLAVQGYGNDAIKVARSMYDGTVTAAYLREHAKLVDDYLDYFSLRRWRLYQHLVKTNSEQAKKITEEHAAELKAEYEKVLPKFTKPNGKQHYDSWRKGVSLRQMAEAVQLGELYPVFYGMASGIQHVDVTGMGHQIADGLFDVAIAPNEKFVREALSVGHNMSVRVLYEFNLVGKVGYDEQINAAGKQMVAVWKALQSSS